MLRLWEVDPAFNAKGKDNGFAKEVFPHLLIFQRIIYLKNQWKNGLAIWQIWMNISNLL